MADKKTKTWQLSIPSGFFPRLKFLQNSFKEALDEHGKSFTTFTKEVFMALDMPPGVLLFSTEDNGLDLCKDFMPTVEDYIQSATNGQSKADMDNLIIQQLTRRDLEINLKRNINSSLLQMYVVIISIEIRTKNGEQEVVLSKESKDMLYYLSDFFDEKHTILYLIDVQNIESFDTAMASDLKCIQYTAREVGKMMNDEDEDLFTRIFMLKGPGIHGKCSRILEKILVDLVENKFKPILTNYDNFLISIKNWNKEECMNNIMIALTKNEEIINNRLLRCRSQRKSWIRSQNMAKVVLEEMHLALKNHAENAMSDMSFDFMSPDFTCDKSLKDITALVHLIHSESPFDLSSFITHESYLHKAQKLVDEFSEKWCTDVENNKAAVEASLKSLSKILKDRQKNISDNIPYIVQLALGRFDHIHTLQMRNGRLIITVSKEIYENANLLATFKKDVENTLKYLNRFYEDFVIQEFIQGVWLFGVLGPGRGIGFLNNDSEFKGGAITAIGIETDDHKIFVITCSHVAPPGHDIYTQEIKYVDNDQSMYIQVVKVGHSIQQLCVTMKEKNIFGYVDFATVPVEKPGQFEINPKYKFCPEGTTIRLFDGDFASIVKSQKELFMLRNSEEHPVYLIYEGELFGNSSSINSHALPDNVGACASATKKDNGSKFQRLDILKPKDLQNTVRPGDSGSAVCFYDSAKNEIVVVFMIIGQYGNQEKYICCRVFEGLELLKMKSNCHIQLLNMK